MKKILCFGDSNVWGFNPVNGKRYKINERWSGILKTTLEKNNDFIVMESGCNNRTCFSDNEIDEMCGIQIIEEVFSNNFTDIVLCLGINDLQFQYKNTIQSLEIGIEKMICKIKSINPKVKILYLAPNMINKNILSSYFNKMFDVSSIELSKNLYDIILNIATKQDFDILNLNDVSNVSCIDSLHYDIENHNKIAQALLNYYLK